MDDQAEMELWQFVIAAPELESRVVRFNLSIRRDVGDAIRGLDSEVWSVLLDQVDDQVRRKIEDSLP